MKRCATLIVSLAAAAGVATSALSEGDAVSDTPQGAPILIAYDIVDGQSIPTPLSDLPGDPMRGASIVAAPEKGGCLACHRVAALIDQQPDQGVSGPALDGIASRISEGSLRLQIVNIGIVTPGSAMPAYYTIAGVEPLTPGGAPEPLLSAQEIEDVIAYLMTLDDG